MPKNIKKVTKKPVAITPVSAQSAPAAAVIPVKTESEKIWDEIKNLPIEMFGLPSQTVAQHCTPVSVDPNRLFLTIRSTATLPALETTLGTKFTVELADKFVIVARPVNSLFQQKK
jgi:hypothetical protein